MQWIHKCDLSWLKERQKHLTATDIKDLLPFTATGRPRKITNSDYLKVLARKLQTLSEENCISTGAAARGHLLEPYAISEFNKIGLLRLAFTPGVRENFELYHWDDVLICPNNSTLAFSPDALNDPTDYMKATILGEVKSYNAEKHLVTSQMPKEQLQERWQIATAMAVLPNLEHAWLILFNPSLKDCSLYAIPYSRKDLRNEIETCFDVAKGWELFLKDDMKRLGYSSTISEQEIKEELEEIARLNPGNVL